MQYWHVAPADYRLGSTLHSPRELRRLAGVRPPEPTGSADEEAVLLFVAQKDAAALQANHGGVLVRVDLPDAPKEVPDYHRHWRRIPGEWVKPAFAIAGDDATSEPHAA